MNIQLSEQATGTVVALSGELDALSAPECEKTLLALVTGDRSRLIVDFQDLAYISSAGLRVLLSSGKAMHAKGGEMIFAQAHGMVHEVLEMSGFLTIFALHDSLDAALAP